jgi:hypothetical protein
VRFIFLNILGCLFFERLLLLPDVFVLEDADHFMVFVLLERLDNIAHTHALFAPFFCFFFSSHSSVTAVEMCTDRVEVANHLHRHTARKGVIAVPPVWPISSQQVASELVDEASATQFLAQLAACWGLRPGCPFVARPARDRGGLGVAMIGCAADLATYAAAVAEYEDVIPAGALSLMDNDVAMAVPPADIFVFEPFVGTLPEWYDAEVEERAATEAAGTAAASLEGRMDAIFAGLDHAVPEATAGARLELLQDGSLHQDGLPTIRPPDGGCDGTTPEGLHRHVRGVGGIGVGGEGPWLLVKGCLLGELGQVSCLGLTVEVELVKEETDDDNPAAATLRRLEAAAEGEEEEEEEAEDAGATVVRRTLELTPPPPTILSPDVAFDIKSRLQTVAEYLGIDGAATITALASASGGEVVVVEVDTLPDLSPGSLLFRQAAVQGTPALEVFNQLLKAGMCRYADATRGALGMREEYEEDEEAEAAQEEEWARQLPPQDKNRGELYYCYCYCYCCSS